MGHYLGFATTPLQCRTLTAFFAIGSIVALLLCDSQGGSYFYNDTASATWMIASGQPFAAPFVICLLHTKNTCRTMV